MNSNKRKHLEAGIKITDLTKKVAQISEKRIWFFVRENVFTGNNDYQIFFSFYTDV